MHPLASHASLPAQKKNNGMLIGIGTGYVCSTTAGNIVYLRIFISTSNGGYTSGQRGYHTHRKCVMVRSCSVEVPPRPVKQKKGDQTCKTPYYGGKEGSRNQNGSCFSALGPHKHQQNSTHLKERSEFLVKLGVPGAVVETRRLAAPLIPCPRRRQQKRSLRHLGQQMTSEPCYGC